MSTTTPLSSAFPTPALREADGLSWIDLAFASDMAKGSGTIFVTDGAVQTVIDRGTGEPTLRVVGASFTKEIPLDRVSITKNLVTFDAADLPAGATLNVYMGAGTLLSGGKPAGAITVPGSAAFTTPAGEPPPPGLSATIAVEDKTLKAGADITVTVSFSKAVNLAPEAISAEHAKVAHLAHSEDMRTWTITLGAADSIDAPANLLRLDMGLVTAADGTRGSGTLTSDPYAVDTIVDAYVFPYLGINDEGPSDEDGVTNDKDQYISGILMGVPAPDEHIELIVNGRTVDQALIHVEHYEDTWYWYYDPEEETGATPTFNEGDNTVSVRLVKADGHSSATVARTIVIDTDTPEIVARPATPVDAGQAIVIGFDEAMYLAGHVEVVDEIEVFDEFGNTSRIVLDDSMFSPDRKTLTISAADHNLAGGNSYILYLPYGLTDLAGNQYEGEEIAFATAGPYQDKAAPRLVQAYIVNGDGSYKAGDVLDIRLRFSESVSLSAGTEPVLYLESDMVAEYAGLADDRKEMIFKYTVEAGDDRDILDDIDHDSVLFGNVRDDAGNVFEREHVDYEGLTTVDGSAADVSIDTTAGQPVAPLLHADSNSGSLDDLLTKDRTPLLTGSGAEAGAKVEIYENDILLGYGVADTSGNWSASVDTAHALADGVHQLVARQIDRAGNGSPAGTPLALTVDGSVSVLGAPRLADGHDTGSSASDGLTREHRPTLVGSGAEAGALIKILSGETVVAIGNADAGGNWSTTLFAVEGGGLADGLHTYTVMQEDLAGNLSAASAALAFTVDRSAPAAPGAPVLAADSDSGSLNNDGITNITAPTFSGSGAEAGATIVLYAGIREIGRQTVDEAGNWTLALLDADRFSADGSYAITAKQTDAAGNTSDASSAFNLVIDTSAPEYIGASSNKALKEFQLEFSEAIRFHPSGHFDLTDNVLVRSLFTNSSANWYLGDGDAGSDTVLNFKVSLTGMFNMIMNNDAVQDVAGNLAVIGVREWVVDLLDGSLP